MSPLRYTKVIHLFGKPRSVVLMPKKLKGRVACLCCARPLSKWQFRFINRQAIGFIRSLLYVQKAILDTTMKKGNNHKWCPNFLSVFEQLEHMIWCNHLILVAWFEILRLNYSVAYSTRNTKILLAVHGILLLQIKT